MSSNLRDMIDGEAELDDDEDDESFDGEAGEPRERKRNGRVQDSSEEEEDDDDEEEARKIREGFIDDDEEEDESEAEPRPPPKRKREHKDREEEAQLDEDDLELIGEQIPEWERKPAQQSKFKRLKRGHRDDEDERPGRRGLDEIFSDDDDEAADQRPYARNNYRAQADEFDDFIEADFPEDENERQKHLEDLEVARPRDKGGVAGVVDTTGLDKDALDDMEAIFGSGEDYDWALQIEEEEEDRNREEQHIELKDVFEPSQLKEKLLTDEDNEIRFQDEPERFQIERKPYKNLQITADQFKEEVRWITNLMWPTKNSLQQKDLHGPFTKAIGKVLEFFIVDDVEVPYVFQHRKDYLIHAKKTPNPDRDRHNPDDPEFIVSAEKLLTQDDLWKILELDIKFRSLIERRNALEKAWENLKSVAAVQDDMLEEMIPKASQMEELQDLQDYLQFQYSDQLKDVAAVAGTEKQQRRPGSKSSLFDRVRRSKAYGFVKAYGITPDQLAMNALRDGRKVTADDDQLLPMDLADSLTDEDFATGDSVLYSAQQMYAEELFVNPRMRKYFRNQFFQMALISCHRTDKGLKKIDESHPYYEIKYLINQTLNDIARRPELFLKMMRAEEDGLVEVRIFLQAEDRFQRQLYLEFESDNYSDRADIWNIERRRVVDLAFKKLEKLVAKGIKDSLRGVCQEEILKICREEYSRRLDQAPYKPKGMMLGTAPRVLALSNGMADPARDQTCWAWVGEDSRIVEQGKFGNLGRDDHQRDEFAKLVARRTPDVIAVSGWSADTHKLVKDLEHLISDKKLPGAEYQDPDTEEYRSELLEVVVVNDEIARLYKDSDRAVKEHPTLNPVTRYCIALARYLQNPMKEYAALGKDIVSLAFHPCQQLLPQDKLLKQLESAMVDMVNLCGVNINEAMSDPYTANLLPYVAGLGPRKATSVVKAINANGGKVISRDELVGDPDSGKLPVVGPRVWNNCASFLYIDYDLTNSFSDPLDNTRVHPEDYELGRKMAADALELDEEDVKAETDENGPGAIVRKLFRDDEQEKVNELILEEYADQLERNYSQRKRATLETIRAELQAPYEELRKAFTLLMAGEIFTMFTGETKDTLAEGMIVPVNIRVVKDELAIVKLDCGIEGRVEAHEVNSRLKDVVQVGQTAQAKILEVDYKAFIAKLTMREDALRRPYRKPIEHGRDSWDYKTEGEDRDELREKDKATGRAQRMVNHPQFRPFNSTQAEEYLGSKLPGEVVIRPSSKGNDHLAVTWKVADGIYQHIDVLEMQKENEFSVGKVLRVGKTSYSDLDELIQEHVKAMSKKVDEMVQHEKFQNRTRNDLEKWLETYMNANPNRSTYAFCLDNKHAGYFWLCFKSTKGAKTIAWVVRVVPNAFELKGHQYPDMRALCNGFKLRYQSEVNKMKR